MRTSPKDPPPDSGFGRVPHVSRGTGKRILVLFAVGAFAPIVILVGGGLSVRFFDWSPPFLAVVSVATTITEEGASMEFEAADRTGIYDANLVARQGKLVQQLWKDEERERQVKVRKTIPIRLGNSFQDGPVDLYLAVSDGSLWGRTTGKLSRVVLDKAPPKIAKTALFVPSRIGEVGGAAFAVTDSNLEAVNLMIGDRATSLQPVAEPKDPVSPRKFVTLFALPFDRVEPLGGAQQRSVRIVARDRAGREAILMLMNPIPTRSDPTLIWKLSDAVVERSVNITFTPQEAELGARGILKLEELNMLDEAARAAERARVLLHTVRPEDTTRLRTWFASPQSIARRFRGPWVRPGGSPSSQFGAQVDIVDKQDVKIGSMIVPGRRYEFSANVKAVGAMAPGKVVFAGILGTYGSTVLLDHGYGVFSGYSGLAEILVKFDEDVQRRQGVGRPGRSGLTNGENGAVIFVGVGGEFADAEPWFRSEGIVDFLDTSIRGFGVDRDG